MYDPLRTYDAWATNKKGEPQTWEQYLKGNKMTRCKCCDWSPNGPQSDYNKGLAANGRKNRLTLDKKTGDTICNICALVVAIDLTREKS